MRIRQKLTSLILALLVIAASTCHIATAQAPSANQNGTFREIPGITEFEIKAIEALQTQHDTFIYGMPLNTECFYREDGSIDGFSRLFCELLTSIFGIQFQPTIYSWQELDANLLSNKIDFSGEVAYSQENINAGYFLTRPIAERTIKLLSHSGRDALSASIKGRPLIFGFLANSPVKTAVEPAIHTRFHSTVLDTVDAAQWRLNNGLIDAMLDDGAMEVKIDPNSNIMIEEFFPITYSTVSFATCNPEFDPIITAMQKYLQADGDGKVRDLYVSGTRLYLQHKLLGQLTQEERVYLEVHQNPAAIIPIIYEYDNYPASFYNERENAWQGIAVDLIKEIELLTGMTFGNVNNRTDDWATMLTNLEHGRAAIISELRRMPDREEVFLWADQPYQTDYYALISKNDRPEIGLGQVKYLRVGIISGSPYETVFFEIFPTHIEIARYDTFLEAFNALERGDIDLLMGSRNALLSATNFMEKVGFKSNIILNRTYASTFGFNKGQAVLAGIISKAQNLIDTQNISDSWIRKVFDYSGKMARAQVPYLIAFSILMAGILTLALILLQKNRKQGRNLEHLVDMRTSQLLERTEDLEVQTEMARVASLAKTDFLSRMSHEIRTPLNAIIGMTEIAKKSDAMDKVQHSLGAITAASSHLLGILNDILDMSKIEAGKFVLIEEPFSLRTAMEEVADIINQRCVEKHIDFVKAFDIEHNAGVVGDKLRLKQVLINLLGNAVKFTPECGHITFSVAAKDDGDNLNIQFGVKDTGIGIPPDRLSKLFVAFEQAHDGISVQYGGTGLGLAISQNLVLKMGGQILVDSAVGEGSLFHFTITLPKAVVEETEKSSVQIAHFPGKRMLLVEDVEINRIILKELLNETQLQIDEAEDGQRAVEIFEQSPMNYYDIVFMDIQMPNLNGYEATEHIRALERMDAKRVPIIAMTANAYKEDVDHATQAGMNEHLSKPIDMDKILETLSRWLGAK